MVEDETTAASEDETALDAHADSMADALPDNTTEAEADSDEYGGGIPTSETEQTSGDKPEAQAVESPTFLQWLYARLTRRKPSDIQELERRLQTLHHSIARHPDAATNYVLRGELYLELGEYERAYQDFNRGLELAAAQFEQENWGIVSQTMRDRAQVGLRNTRKHLRRNG